MPRHLGVLARNHDFAVDRCRSSLSSDVARLCRGKMFPFSFAFSARRSRSANGEIRGLWRPGKKSRNRKNSIPGPADAETRWEIRRVGISRDSATKIEHEWPRTRETHGSLPVIRPESCFVSLLFLDPSLPCPSPSLARHNAREKLSRLERMCETTKRVYAVCASREAPGCSVTNSRRVISNLDQHRSAADVTST